MILESGDWLTAERARRLPIVLTAVARHPHPGVVPERAGRVIWGRCGGPMSEVPRLIEILVRTDLIENRGGYLRVTREGRRVATQDHQSGGRLLAAELIKVGLLAGQARRLVEMSTIDAAGDLHCSRAVAVENAAQLVGLMRRWTDVDLHEHLIVPASVVRLVVDGFELAPELVEDLLDPKKAVGNRAEAYSYRREREVADDPNAVRWVSLDDDTLGYDIEISSVPPRFVEVKGSVGEEVQFYMSENEMRVASQDHQYEIQYWGEIDLGKSRIAEYEELVAKDFPLVFMAYQLTDGTLIPIPHVYRVRVAETVD